MRKRHRPEECTHNGQHLTGCFQVLLSQVKLMEEQKLCTIQNCGRSHTYIWRAVCECDRGARAVSSGPPEASLLTVSLRATQKFSKTVSAKYSSVVNRYSANWFLWMADFVF